MLMPAMIRRRCTAKMRPKTRRRHASAYGIGWLDGSLGGWVDAVCGLDVYGRWIQPMFKDKA